jgi:hypothetical protein
MATLLLYHRGHVNLLGIISVLIYVLLICAAEGGLSYLKDSFTECRIPGVSLCLSVLCIISPLLVFVF